MTTNTANWLHAYEAPLRDRVDEKTARIEAEWQQFLDGTLVYLGYMPRPPAPWWARAAAACIALRYAGEALR